MDSTNLIYFLGASILLTIAPGPDNIFVITQGISRGRKTAVLTALGMCSGISVHTLAAALGVSAIFYSSSVAFQIVKYLGAVYLIYLAWKAIKESGTAEVQNSTDNTPTSLALFRRGFFMNVLNPKVALFFLAFLPQFSSIDGGNIAIQMAILGLIFMGQSIAIFSLIGYFSGSIGNLFLGKPKVSKVFGWLSASVFLALGVRLVFTEK